MKKNYRKPILVVETYNMAQSIADGGCTDAGGGATGSPTWGNPDECVWSTGPDQNFFTDGTERCNMGEPTDIGCYQAPTPGHTIWGS